MGCSAVLVSHYTNREGGLYFNEVMLISTRQAESLHKSRLGPCAPVVPLTGASLDRSRSTEHIIV